MIWRNISGSVSKPSTSSRTHRFSFDSDKIVLIETDTRGAQHPFRLPKDDLTINMPVIQKGEKPIDGRLWEIYIRALPEFPEHIFSAIRQKGISIEPYRCGLEIGAGKTLDRFHRIYVKYIKCIDKCQTLPQNGDTISDEQLQSIRELANQFDENITISDHSAGS